MNTTSMPKRQVWMTDHDQLNHTVKNSQKVLSLNDQYENHPYAEEFTKGCNVMFVYGTFVLKGEADAKFSLGIYGIYFRKPSCQTTKAIFAGK